MSWDDIQRITAYKIDMFSWDEVRMEFKTREKAVVITEESPGFVQFMAEVVRRFPSTSEWHSKVSQPAFDPCPTTLFERQDPRLDDA